MELDIAIFNKLINLIDEAKNNNNYELEARFWNKNNDFLELVRII